MARARRGTPVRAARGHEMRPLLTPVAGTPEGVCAIKGSAPNCRRAPTCARVLRSIFSRRQI